MRRLFGHWTLWMLAGFPLLAFLLVPIVAIIQHAITNRPSLTDEFQQAIRLSLMTSLASASLVVFLGTPLAFALARFRFPLRKLMIVGIDLPLALPPAAAGIGLLLAFGRHGLVPTNLAFTTAAVVLAQAFVSCPFYIRNAINAFSAVSSEIEESAALDGAGPMTLFQSITLPISSRSLVSGGITAWARGLGEFGATILFAGNLVGKTQTMPLAIYLGFESDLDQAVMLAGILLVIAVATILTVRWLSDLQS